MLQTDSVIFLEIYFFSRFFFLFLELLPQPKITTRGYTVGTCLPNSRAGELATEAVRGREDPELVDQSTATLVAAL